MKRLVLTLTVLCLFTPLAHAFDYDLKPESIAEDTWVLIGSTEDLTPDNGGNILNTGFIVTEQGVIVIDSGPSKAYGEALRDAISSVTDKPILRVLLTHHHPDHLFGAQVFGDTVFTTKKILEAIEIEGEGLLNNLYRNVGKAMQGTAVSTQIQVLDVTEETVGGHRLEYVELSGHSDSDLVIIDHSTGVIFSGDLVFNQRALTTPHADPAAWQDSLQRLAALEFNTLVPGHGPLVSDVAPIQETAAYLAWLEQFIANAVAEGKDMNAVIRSPIPAQFQSLDGVRREFERSVIHRFPVHEQALFK